MISSEQKLVKVCNTGDDMGKEPRRTVTAGRSLKWVHRFIFLAIKFSLGLERTMSSLSEAQRLALRTFVQRIVGPTPNLELDGRFIHHIIDYTYEPRYVWFAPCGGVIDTVMLLYEQATMHDGRYVALVRTRHFLITQ